MRESVFVEMVDVCYAKVERCCEGQGCGRRSRKYQQMQRKQKRAEQQLFRERPSDEITPSDPAAERLVQIRSFDPFAPARFNGGPFEQGAGKQEHCKQRDLADIERGKRIPA